MLRRGTAAALAALALALSGCEGRTRTEAAESAERLLAAAQAEDRVAFEAEIDRAAVREDLRRQMIEVARANGIDVEGGPSDLALDRMIGPAALRLVRAGDGAPAEPPTARQLARRMKVTEEKRVCLPALDDRDVCLLTFGKAADRWRLVGMQAMDLTIQVAAGPARE